MSIEIKVPQLPESVSSATVGAWTVAEGDAISRDQNVLELETDKVMLDVPAAEGGVLKEIRIKAGESVKAGDVLVQRGTNHAWSNRSNKNAAIAFVLIGAKPRT